MSTIPSLAEHDIRERVGDQNYQRGLGYFRNDAITSPRREGSALKARCWGTADEPYRVSVTFADGKIDQAECSCPVGYGGACKHVAALLLTWQARPGDFVEVEELAASLERRTKPELIALIDHMLRRDPDLESLLELPLPKHRRTGPPADRDAFRRQAAAVIHRHPAGQWGVEGIIATELQDLREIGDGFAGRDDLASAAAVYESLAVEVIENYEFYPYDEGELTGVVDDSVKSLASLLDRPSASVDERRDLLKSLVAIYRANVENAGEYEVGGSAAIDVVLAKATPAEHIVVAEWIRSALRESGDRSDDSVEAEAYGDLLFDLEKSTYDDLTFIEESRKRGRVVELVDRLLSLGRVDEAVATARSSTTAELGQVLDQFVARGQSNLAEQLARERLTASPDPAILSWQQQRYAQQGDDSSALAIAKQIFQLQPSLPLYAAARESAGRLGQWELVRDWLRSTLRATQRRDLLIEACLDDGDVGAAVDEVLGRSAELESPAADRALGPAALQVAAAAEQTQPHDAIEIYVRYAERLIEYRGRDNYQMASTVLRNVRRLYERLGELDVWRGFVAELRARNRKLRAFQEELDRAEM